MKGNFKIDITNLIIYTDGNKEIKTIWKCKVGNSFGVTLKFAYNLYKSMTQKVIPSTSLK